MLTEDEQRTLTGLRVRPCVIIESPYAAPTPEGVERNMRYLRACMRDCLLKGEAPFASHGLYTQPGVLRDEVPAEREVGMAAGWSWLAGADRVAVYTDLGITKGMERGIFRAVAFDCVIIEYRTLGGEWAQEDVEDA